MAKKLKTMSEFCKELERVTAEKGISWFKKWNGHIRSEGRVECPIWEVFGVTPWDVEMHMLGSLRDRIVHGADAYHFPELPAQERGQITKDRNQLLKACGLEADDVKIPSDY